MRNSDPLALRHEADLTPRFATWHEAPNHGLDHLQVYRVEGRNFPNEGGVIPVDPVESWWVNLSKFHYRFAKVTIVL